jgi:hypothetical protein
VKEIQGSIENYRMIITEKQMVDEGLADVPMVVNYVTKERQQEAQVQTTDGSVEPVVPSTQRPLCPGVPSKYIKFLTAFGCTTVVDTRQTSRVLLSTQHSPELRQHDLPQDLSLPVPTGQAESLRPHQQLRLAMDLTSGSATVTRSS